MTLSDSIGTERGQKVLPDPQPMRPPTAPEARPLASGSARRAREEGLRRLGAEDSLQQRSGACPKSQKS